MLPLHFVAYYLVWWGNKGGEHDWPYTRYSICFHELHDIDILWRWQHRELNDDESSFMSASVLLSSSMSSRRPSFRQWRRPLLRISFLDIRGRWRWLPLSYNPCYCMLHCQQAFMTILSFFLLVQNPCWNALANFVRLSRRKAQISQESLKAFKIHWSRWIKKIPDRVLFPNLPPKTDSTNQTIFLD